MEPKIRPARPDEIGALLGIILSANPHLALRLETFIAGGAHWYKATPVLCRTGKELVSCAVLFHRQIWTGQGKARLGGIAAVSTIPSARRCGYASAVLAYCEDFLRAQGYPLAVLFCTIINFYERRGWSRVQEDWVEFSLRGPVSKAGLQDYHLSPFDPALMSEALSRLYDDTSEETGGALVRCQELWKEYTAWRREAIDLFWTASEQNEPVAYVRGRWAEGGVLLLEVTCRQGHEAALLLLLDQQRNMAGGEKSVAFRALLSPKHPLAELLTDAGVPLAWRKTGADTSMMMIKPLQQISPTNNSCSSDWERSLSLHDFDRELPWWPRTWWGIDRF
jgi:predicted acetyltransferase